jgi:hypothetical protein
MGTYLFGLGTGQFPGTLGTTEPTAAGVYAGIDPATGHPVLVITDGGTLSFTLEVDGSGNLIFARPAGATFLTLEASDVIKNQVGWATSNIVTPATTYVVASAAAVVLANAASGAFTATLQAPAGETIGQRWVIKKTDSSGNAVTVSPASGTIDGAASVVLSAQYQWVEVVNDGTNYWIIGTGTA